MSEFNPTARRDSLLWGAALVCGVTLLAAGAVSAAPGAGRLALLGAEAARFAAPAEPATPFGPMPWVAGSFCAGICAAFLGTFFGMRAFAFARWIERDGWREVTVRFRSAPLAIRGDIIPRMTGLLEELEVLASARRNTEPAPSRPRIEPVTFARREEPPRIVLPERDGHAPSLHVPAVPAPAPQEPSTLDPASKYRRARELLRDGHDAATIQVMTGLKRAEIDLVRWSPRFGAAS